MIPDIETTHARLVLDLIKPGDAICQELDAKQAHLLHMAFGVAGEAGELLDAIKKAAIYQKPIDLINVIEELGDLEFYMQGLRHALGVSRLETLRQNTDKLTQRYPLGSYSNHHARARADKEVPAE